MTLSSHHTLTDGIDVFDGSVYWTNMGVPSKNDGCVQSAHLDGSDVKTVIPVGNVHTVKQLHVDREAKKRYFCDREALRVMRCNLDGSEHETIIQTGDWQTEPEKAQIQTNWPVGITVSHRLNKFFWTQTGGSKSSHGRILAALLSVPNGSTLSNRQDIEAVQGNLPEGIDLEIDDESGVLCWTDRGELPPGNTLDKEQIIGHALEAEERSGGRQIVSDFNTPLPAD